MMEYLLTVYGLIYRAAFLSSVYKVDRTRKSMLFARACSPLVLMHPTVVAIAAAVLSGWVTCL